MTESLDKAPENKKKMPLTAGTAIFMSACFLLVMGLCKFSFYVLKNHRSAVSRDEFIQTYVDVQPLSAEKEHRTATRIILKESESVIPADFFKPAAEKKETVVARVSTAPLPVYKRPPVIRPKPEPAVVKPMPAEETVPDADSLPISLDTLMAEGKDVLDSSDKLFLDSQDLLAEDENVVAQADVLAPAKAVKPPPALATAEPAAVKTVAAKPAETKQSPVKSASVVKTETAERWIDIAALREQIKREQANASFMDDSGKVAAAAVHETDAVEAKAAPETVKETAAVVKKEETPAASPAVQTAAKEPASVPASPFLTKEQIAQSNLLPKSPWKVAKVGGKSSNALAVKDGAVKKEEPATAKSQTSVAEAPQAKVIYKNGRAKKIDMPAESDKSLNWLDRKEAAVWTSLSQSDSPSVWAIGDSRPAETAKAFRVAAEETEQPEKKDEPAEKNEISSAPVRTVGKEEKPEAIANPVLLPLGTSAGTPAPVAAQNPTATAPAPAATATPAAAPIIPAAAQTATPAADEQKAADPSLVNKLFSIFNSSSADEPLPTIGGAVPLSDDKKEEAPAPEPAAAEVKTVVLKEAPAAAKTADKDKEQEILPSEIRLTFKPDGAEMSAQSVKWIKAFGLRVKKDIQRAIEVRMSNENIALQEKRFALIRSTLVGVGVNDAQIVPFMTNRSPHTIILRIFDVPEEGVTEYTTSLDGTKETLYYRKW